MHSLGGSLPAGPLLQHAPDGGGAQVQTGPTEHVGDASLAHGRAEHLEPPHEVSDEIGVLVDRLGRLDESVRSFLTEASHPGGDGRRCHDHVFGRLFEGPGSGGPQLEDGETLHGLIVGPPMAWARAAVSANCASEMACRTAERTRSFQCLGRGKTG